MASAQAAGPLRGALAFIAFFVLQVAMLPLTVLALVWVAYRQLLVSRRLGASQTGIEVINGRWAMHIFGIREDESTARLASVLPNTSTGALWLCFFPLWVKYRISGSHWLYPRVPPTGHEDIRDIVVSRTLHFDRILMRTLSGVEQFVILGAGYDTRSYGPLARPDLACFEVDQEGTQRLKIDAMQKAGIDSSHVTFLTVDFSRDDLFERLREAGYDATRPSVFLWEGVTLYLSESDVRKTLGDIRDNAPTGSVVVADVYAQRLLRIGTGRVRGAVLESTGESFVFGLPDGDGFEPGLRSLVDGADLTLGETCLMGHETAKGVFMAVTEIRV